MILLLHNRYEYNANAIYRTALGRKWHVRRVDFPHNIASVLAEIKNSDELCKHTVRYYGNTWDISNANIKLPMEFLPVSIYELPNIPQTGRHICLSKLYELPEFVNKFVKPAQNKWFPAKIYASSSEIPTDCSLCTDDVYIQDVVDIVNEVRCFCLDGKILTASLYKVSRAFCPIPYESDVRDQVIDKMVEEIAPHYPAGVVLDFGYTSDGKWIFIEPNEAWASGIYTCDPSKCLDVIIESQETI